MPTEYAIEMKGITKTFGSVVANRDVELNVRQGRSWPCWVRTARARPP